MKHGQSKSTNHICAATKEDLQFDEFLPIARNMPKSSISR